MDAFNWTNGEVFLEAYNKVYPNHEQKWTGYIEEQFHLMQTDAIYFVSQSRSD